MTHECAELIVELCTIFGDEWTNCYNQTSGLYWILCCVGAVVVVIVW